ncbi:MAG TPA: formate dehydrogenase accessory protein FdhE [Rhodanobacteraceae bacterium]|nr:formate dehydrogenase accessory protein FdhE [Rhodanobacteraceae bacterium]
MTQRILAPGEIESLAQRSIPRVRLPDRSRVFAHRARRLRDLAAGSSIEGYLRLLAVVADAQQAALAGFVAPLPDAAAIERAKTHRMPSIAANGWPRDAAWRDVLKRLVDAAAAHPGAPEPMRRLAERVRSASAQMLEAEADAVLSQRTDALDLALAPFVAAALQVHWTALTAAFAADRVALLDTPGVCPLCGSLPVASLVRARSPYLGYRYLHCALCATEWHMVRVQCSQCAAIGKDIAYHSLAREDADEAAVVADSAVRAESCEACRSYRKILYQEKDTAVEPVADDLASLALDLLLAERGYHRASGNPLLWQAGG